MRPSTPTRTGRAERSGSPLHALETGFRSPCVTKAPACRQVSIAPSRRGSACGSSRRSSRSWTARSRSTPATPGPNSWSRYRGEPSGRTLEAEVLAQRRPFVIRAKQAALLQDRHHPLDEVVELAGKERRHHVDAVGGSRAEPAFQHVGD